MLKKIFKLAFAGFLLACAAVPSAYASNDLLKKLYDMQSSRKAKDKPFSLGGEFGFLATDGNTKTTTFKSSLTADHEMEKWSNKYFTEFVYKRNESINEEAGSVTAQRFLSAVQLDYKLKNNKNRLFVYAEYDDDRFNGFRYQAALAAGYSTVAWKNDESQFRYSVGPGYSQSEKKHVEQNRYEIFRERILRASLDYRLKISEGARFRQFFSAEAGEENKRSRSETSITANIIDSLAMKLSFVMIYNNAKIELNEDLSTETSISLVYQFF